MNIFVIDLDPEVCAQMHCDKHVSKMLTETSQMMSNAYYSTYRCETVKVLIHKMYFRLPHRKGYSVL